MSRNDVCPVCGVNGSMLKCWREVVSVSVNTTAVVYKARYRCIYLECSFYQKRRTWVATL